MEREVPRTIQTAGIQGIECKSHLLDSVLQRIRPSGIIAEHTHNDEDVANWTSGARFVSYLHGYTKRIDPQIKGSWPESWEIRLCILLLTRIFINHDNWHALSLKEDLCLPDCHWSKSLLLWHLSGSIMRSPIRHSLAYSIWTWDCFYSTPLHW